jgi:hypothetical protein
MQNLHFHIGLSAAGLEAQPLSGFPTTNQSVRKQHPKTPSMAWHLHLGLTATDGDLHRRVPN